MKHENIRYRGFFTACPERGYAAFPADGILMPSASQGSVLCVFQHIALGLWEQVQILRYLQEIYGKGSN